MPDNKSPDDLRSRYRAIKEERQRRIDEHKRSIAARPATATNLNILADGDSWFKYSPSMDVIDFVRQDGNPTPQILNLAVAGDPTTATLGVSKRQDIINNLRDPENVISMHCSSREAAMTLSVINSVYGLHIMMEVVTALTPRRFRTLWE